MLNRSKNNFGAFNLFTIDSLTHCVFNSRKKNGDHILGKKNILKQ
jgi:hypothetical protein